MQTFAEITITVSPSEVLRLQGYPPGQQPRQEVAHILAEMMEEGYRLVEPRALYAEAGVADAATERIVLADGMVLEAGNAARAWRRLERVGVAVCTIGAALERRVGDLFAEGEYARALMLDSVGSVAAEAVADYVNHEVCQQAAAGGAHVGPRLSPGYGKWDVRGQATIFALLPTEQIGVHLNEQCMMLPRKSVSFCMGIGRHLIPSRRASQCSYCTMESCQYRREESAALLPHISL